MPKTDTHVTALLKLLFNNEDGSGAAADTAYTMAGTGATRTIIQKSGTPGSVYVSLHTSSPGYGGTPSTNEISYTGYGRIPVACSTAGWTVGSPDAQSVTNAADLTFGQMTGGTGGLARFWGVGTIPSAAGTTLDLWYFGALQLQQVRGCSVDATGVTNNDILCPAHGYAAGDNVQFVDAAAGVVPGGLTEGTWYYVISTGLATDTFRVSTSIGGGAVDISGQGVCYVAKALEQTVSLNVEPTIKAGKIIISER